MADRLGAAFMDESRRRSEVVAGAATQFLDDQLSNVRSQLEANEGKLAEFKSRYAGELPSEFQSNVLMLQSTYGQLQTLQEALGPTRDEAGALDALIADMADAGPSAHDASDGRGSDSAKSQNAGGTKHAC